MRIVIDMQGAQTASAKRGIGRYTVELVKGLLRQKEAHEIIAVFNALLPDTIAAAQDALAGLLPAENILLWSGVGPTEQKDEANTWRRGASELLRESFLASLNPDFLLITSLFEGFDDSAVGSIDLCHRIPTGVILYDLIPHIRPQYYLADAHVANWYSERLRHFARADLWLAISESSRREGIGHLDLPEGQVINISTAAHDHFRQRKIAAERRAQLLKAIGISRPFVLTTGGAEPRKNVERLLEAFSKLPDRMSSTHQLVVYGAASSRDRLILMEWLAKYNLGRDQVILTDYITDDDLADLYNCCELFVFPSWYEGFGLPALEAMQCGTPTIGANTTSLPEVIGREDAMFDPYSVEDIAAKIARALSDNVFRDALVEHAHRHAQRFSWDITSARALAAIENAHAAAVTRQAFAREDIYRALIERIVAIPHDMAEPSDEDLLACADAIDRNQARAESFHEGRSARHEVFGRASEYVDTRETSAVDVPSSPAGSLLIEEAHADTPSVVEEAVAPIGSAAMMRSAVKKWKVVPRVRA